MNHPQDVTRRHFLRDGSMGLGAMALATLGGATQAAEPAQETSGVVNPLASRDPHFSPKVKHVIYLHMAGSPPRCV